jgi:hypothetical protein
MGTPSIIVFDVNETLIDIESIGPFVERKFGDRKVLREWFNQLILYSNVITLSGHELKIDPHMKSFAETNGYDQIEDLCPLSAEV